MEPWPPHVAVDEEDLLPGLGQGDGGVEGGDGFPLLRLAAGDDDYLGGSEDRPFTAAAMARRAPVVALSFQDHPA